MGNVVIKAENIGKLYKLGEIGTGTISHDLNRWFAKIRGKEDPFAKIGETNDRTAKGNSDWVWALKDINFEVKQGEVLGIIGRNGAGKSTLLKILSKVTTPSTGRIKTKGRIASLLEVGTGFHQELTGRENIFLNGAILGMRKAEIRSKLDEIIDFAGVERYIDTPVKRYSSGMYVRLAFAVAAHLEPEILIIDEVLAVGDMEFQKKCMGKMEEVSKKDGRTILFVSHNMPSIKNLCTKGIVLVQGTKAFEGESGLVIDYYVSNDFQNNLPSFIEITENYRKYDLSRKIEYNFLEFLDPQDGNIYSTLDEIQLRIRLRGNESFSRFRLSFSIKGLDDLVVGTYFSGEILSIKQGELKDFVVIMKDHQLAKGRYYLDLSVGIGSHVSGMTEYDNVSKTLFFEIAYNDTEKKEMISLWPSGWGSINFHNFQVKSL